MTVQSHVAFGTIISGTMRAEDIIPEFSATLNFLCGGQGPHMKLCNEADAIDWETIDGDVDKADYACVNDILDELFDALNEYSPPNGYFGAHDGDGSDYGYWPVHTDDRDYDWTNG